MGSIEQRFSELRDAFLKEGPVGSGEAPAEPYIERANRLVDHCATTGSEAISRLLELLGRPAADQLKVVCLRQLSAHAECLDAEEVAERLALVARSGPALAVVELLEKIATPAALFTLRRVCGIRDEEEVAAGARAAASSLTSLLPAPGAVGLGALDECLFTLLAMDPGDRVKAWQQLDRPTRDAVEQRARERVEEIRSRRSSVKQLSFAGRLRDVVMELAVLVGWKDGDLPDSAAAAFTKWAGRGGLSPELLKALPDEFASDFARRLLARAKEDGAHLAAALSMLEGPKQSLVSGLREEILAAAGAVPPEIAVRLWRLVHAATSGRDEEAVRNLLRQTSGHADGIGNAAAVALASAPESLSVLPLVRMSEAARARVVRASRSRAAKAHLAIALLEAMRVWLSVGVKEERDLLEWGLAHFSKLLPDLSHREGDKSVHRRLIALVDEVLESVSAEASGHRRAGEMARVDDPRAPLLEEPAIVDAMASSLGALIERHPHPLARWLLVCSAVSTCESAAGESVIDLDVVQALRSDEQARAYVDTAFLPEAVAAGLISPSRILVFAKDSMPGLPPAPWRRLLDDLRAELDDLRRLEATATKALRQDHALRLRGIVERSSELVVGNPRLEGLLREVGEATGSTPPTNPSPGVGAATAPPGQGEPVAALPKWVELADMTNSLQEATAGLLRGGTDALPAASAWSEADVRAMAGLLQRFDRRLFGPAAAGVGDGAGLLWARLVQGLADAGRLDRWLLEELKESPSAVLVLSPPAIESVVERWLGGQDPAAGRRIAESLVEFPLPPLHRAAVSKACIEFERRVGGDSVDGGAELSSSSAAPSSSVGGTLGDATWEDTVRQCGELARQVRKSRGDEEALVRTSLRHFALRASGAFERLEAAMSVVAELRLTLSDLGLAAVEQQLGVRLPVVNAKRHRAVAGGEADAFIVRSHGFALSDEDIVTSALLDPGTIES